MSATTTWKPKSDEDYNRLKGRVVVDAEGKVVGTLYAVFHPPTAQSEERGLHIFLIEPDPGQAIFEHDALYITEDHVRSVEGDSVRLDVPRERLTGDVVSPPANIAIFQRK
jgi:hypothetical protein